MNKILTYIFIVIVVVVGVFYLLNSSVNKERDSVLMVDHKNAEYVVAGERIKLTNGISEITDSSNSVSKITTKYFGNELREDLNDDGREDIVFLLTQETGGSGIFYYVVAALNTGRGYVGGEALFLGDRIAPQTTEKGKGKIIIVNYADRAQGEPFSTSPSIGKSIWLILDTETMQFGEVVQNFDGEADPKRLKLDMKTWNWVRALYNDGREIIPKQPNKFTLTFLNDGRFSAGTDCNSMGGHYEAEKGTISFDQIVSTLMFCEGSQEAEFVNLLQDTQGYHFTSKGELVLDLKFDSGSVIFR